MTWVIPCRSQLLSPDQVLWVWALGLEPKGRAAIRFLECRLRRRLCALGSLCRKRAANPAPPPPRTSAQGALARSLGLGEQSGVTRAVALPHHPLSRHA